MLKFLKDYFFQIKKNCEGKYWFFNNILFFWKWKMKKLINYFYVHVLKLPRYLWYSGEKKWCKKNHPQKYPLNVEKALKKLQAFPLALWMWCQEESILFVQWAMVTSKCYVGWIVCLKGHKRMQHNIVHLSLTLYSETWESIVAVQGWCHITSHVPRDCPHLYSFLKTKIDF
jgi:hypothetical protein